MSQLWKPFLQDIGLSSPTPVPPAPLAVEEHVETPVQRAILKKARRNAKHKANRLHPQFVKGIGIQPPGHEDLDVSSDHQNEPDAADESGVADERGVTDEPVVIDEPGVTDQEPKGGLFGRALGHLWSLFGYSRETTLADEHEGSSHGGVDQRAEDEMMPETDDAEEGDDDGKDDEEEADGAETSEEDPNAAGIDEDVKKDHAKEEGEDHVEQVHNDSDEHEHNPQQSETETPSALQHQSHANRQTSTTWGPHELLCPRFPGALLTLREADFADTQRADRIATLAYDTLADRLWRTVIFANYFSNSTPFEIGLPRNFQGMPTEQQRFEILVRESKLLGGPRRVPADQAAVENDVLVFLSRIRRQPTDTLFGLTMANRSMSVQLHNRLREERVVTRRNLYGMFTGSYEQRHGKNDLGVSSIDLDCLFDGSGSFGYSGQ